MSKQLLIESITNQKFSPKTDGDKYIVEGILTRKDEKRNHNGRIYPEETLLREVEKYKNTCINQNRAMGELDHPDASVINLKNVSHNILKCWWDGDDLIGKIEILKTPCGNIARALFEAKIPVGISSRALGTTKNISEGTVEVQDDLELLAFDLVSVPSCPGAFLSPSTITEGINPNLLNRKPENKIEEIIREILTTLS